MTESDAGPASEGVQRSGGPRARLGASCVIAALIGLGVPAAQHRRARGTAYDLLFAVWLFGPLVGGAVLRSPRFLLYLAPSVVWYVMLPASMIAGWMTPAQSRGDFSPAAAVVYLVGALPFAVTVAAVASFAAGTGCRWAGSYFRDSV